jgi:kumamolisin
MKKLSSPFRLAASLLPVLLLVSALPAVAQSGRAAVITPNSSVERPEDVGVRAHTNILLVVPNEARLGTRVQSQAPQEAPPFPGYLYETPASIACVYQLVRTFSPGCNPNNTTVNPKGGANAIAVVDAFDDPTAQSDLATFDGQFGIAAPDFTVVYSTGTEPALDPTGGWELEESLDIEWAHALAPQAKLFLVEAPSESPSDLAAAAVVASKLVASNGGGEVSMSWGFSEFDGQTTLDSAFTTPGVVYFASAGDEPGVIWPSTSPTIVAAGGTSNVRNLNNGAFVRSVAWQSTGGGPSAVYSRPFYQNVIARIVGQSRATPDVSFDADPTSGVWIYDSSPYLLVAPEGLEEVVIGWTPVGGTSVSSPSLAAITNAAGRFLKSSASELAVIYGNLGNNRAFDDVGYGTCGPYEGYLTTFGWDFCTGVGTDVGLFGK